MVVDVPKILEAIGLKSESYSKIRFGQGVVGKTSMVALSVVFVLGTIAYKLENYPWMQFLLALIIAGGFFWYFKRTIKFSEENPQLALMDGAELVAWKQIDLAAKGIPSPPDTPAIANPQTANLSLIEIKPEQG